MFWPTHIWNFLLSCRHIAYLCIVGTEEKGDHALPEPRPYFFRFTDSTSGIKTHFSFLFSLRIYPRQVNSTENPTIPMASPSTLLQNPALRLPLAFQPHLVLKHPTMKHQDLFRQVQFRNFLHAIIYAQPDYELLEDRTNRLFWFCIPVKHTTLQSVQGLNHRWPWHHLREDDWKDNCLVSAQMSVWLWLNTMTLRSRVIPESQFVNSKGREK